MYCWLGWSEFNVCAGFHGQFSVAYRCWLIGNILATISKASLTGKRFGRPWLLIFSFSLSIMINHQPKNLFVQLSWHSEPNDLDTIYKVLKKAGEISAAAEKNQASGSSQPTMEIPDINVPDYPDRNPRSRPMKSNAGPMSQQQKQGLAAPTMADVSSSGPKMQQISLTPPYPPFSLDTNTNFSLFLFQFRLRPPRPATNVRLDIFASHQSPIHSLSKSNFEIAECLESFARFSFSFLS